LENKRKFAVPHDVVFQARNEKIQVFKDIYHPLQRLSVFRPPILATGRTEPVLENTRVGDGLGGDGRFEYLHFVFKDSNLQPMLVRLQIIYL
jgi:hypothetical protein